MSCFFPQGQAIISVNLNYIKNLNFSFLESIYLHFVPFTQLPVGHLILAPNVTILSSLHTRFKLIFYICILSPLVIAKLRLHFFLFKNSPLLFQLLL